MAYRAAKPNFSKGELADDLLGRFDVEAYGAGLKRARNVIIMKYGGITKRPGTRLVAEVHDDSQAIRLIPFQFSIDQAYVLEMGHNYMRPAALGGVVLDGSDHVIVTSPYSGAQLAELDYEQSADVIYLAHIDQPPTKLNRLSNTDWEFVTVTFGPTITPPTISSIDVENPNVDSENSGNGYFPLTDGYVVTAVDDDTGQESRASNLVYGTNDLTLKRNYNKIFWGAVTGADRYRVYKSHEYGTLGYIGTTENLEFVDDNVGPDFTDAPPVGDNPFDAANNYPSTVTFFEQRLMWARSRNQPNVVWGSRSGDFENMDVSSPLKADDAISFRAVANRVNSVNQLVPLDSLLLLTSDNIFKVTGANDDYISPAPPPRVRRQIGRGASRLNPLIVDGVVFYQPSIGNRVRALGYSFEADGVKSDDVTIFSPHFFDGFNIVSWAYAQEPRSIVWAARDDGKLLCFTWEQEQQIWGWTLCETDGLVEQVCVISEEGEDRLYLTVRRTVGGADKLFLERMATADWDEVDDACFLDCAITYEFETPTNTLTGLDHLEGRTIKAVVDGNVRSGLVVTDGAVTLPFTFTRATAGLPYEAVVETLPLSVQSQDGWNIGKRQQAGTVVVRVVKTRGLIVGPKDDPAYLFPLKPRSDEAFGEPNALKTGDYEMSMAPAIEGETKIVIKSDEPLPMTITAVLIEPRVTN